MAEPIDPDLSALIMSVGDRGFGGKLVELLDKICGAEYAAVFRLDGDELIEILAAGLNAAAAEAPNAGDRDDEDWRRDPMLRLALEALDPARIGALRDEKTSAYEMLRDLVHDRASRKDRAVICAPSEDGIIGLSLLRSSQTGSFRPADLERVRTVAGALFALIPKHVNIAWEAPNLATALTSLAEIEVCLAEQVMTMPKREAEVTSRTIYGVSSLKIAQELGISEVTVQTYRKRIYARLGIASQRELLRWYLKLWSEWPGRIGGRDEILG
ncbi:MAG: LuxR C-terminal-related transcriptional regulator [Amphiplicatus sp.]